jgi:predicted enzyme related to lactoylglutathione lyase
MSAPPRVAHVIVDCADPLRLATFWTELLGSKITGQDDEWVDTEPVSDGGPAIGFVVVPEAKTVKNRVHFDLEVADLDGERERVLALGGRVASEVQGQQSRFQVFYDPEGNEFCLVESAS